jgi:hypothetical protein
VFYQPKISFSPFLPLTWEKKALPHSDPPHNFGLLLPGTKPSVYRMFSRVETPFLYGM